MSGKNQKKTTFYQAPKPKTPRFALAQMFLLRLFFPPVLLWDIAKFAVNRLLGKAISRLVLPAQDRGYEKHFKDFSTEGAESFTVVTHDGACLDTIEIRNKKVVPVLPKKQKYIINFLGNGQCYEQIIDEMKEEAQALKCQVIGFNPRGVSQSSSKPQAKDDLVTDGIAQVQRLLDKGIHPENITIKGYSLGGAIGTLVTKHFHDHGLKINLFNDRSFSTITNFLVGQLALNGHQETSFRKILGWLIKPILTFALALTKWEMDAASAYKAIPDTHKEYMVVRSSKKQRAADEKIKDDEVITHYASLHAALRDERRQYKKTIDAALQSTNSKNTYSIAKEPLEAAGKQLQEARSTIKARKMTCSGSNPHCSARDDLKDRYQGHSGKEFFRSFFRRAQEHHRQREISAILSPRKKLV